MLFVVLDTVGVFNTGLVAVAVTVTVHVAVLLVSPFAFAVIVAVPAAIPVTTPVADTVATAVLLDDHVTVLSVALDGDTVAVSGSVCPAVTVPDVCESVIPVGEITGAAVVCVTRALGADAPALFAAVTSKVYEVAASKPVAVKVVDDV